MTSEPLFKAVIRYRHPDLFSGNIEAVDIHTRLVEWLADNGRANHYVNAYLNCTPCGDSGELVVVLTDRNTAIMLKLALD